MKEKHIDNKAIIIELDPNKKYWVLVDRRYVNGAQAREVSRLLRDGVSNAVIPLEDISKALKFVENVDTVSNHPKNETD